jgi:hypothetical protein
MMMRLTRRQEQREAGRESVGNAKEKERRRESVKQTNTAAGISSNPGDHPHIFFFLDFFSVAGHPKPFAVSSTSSTLFQNPPLKRFHSINT